MDGDAERYDMSREEGNMPGVDNFNEDVLEEDEKYGLDLKLLHEDLSLVSKMEELEERERDYLARREAFEKKYGEYVDARQDTVTDTTLTDYTDEKVFSLEEWRKLKEGAFLEEYDALREEKVAAFEAHKKLEGGQE
jgi:hypothetical protein